MSRRQRHLRAVRRSAGRAAAITLAGVALGWSWGGRHAPA